MKRASVASTRALCSSEGYNIPESRNHVRYSSDYFINKRDTCVLQHIRFNAKTILNAYSSKDFNILNSVFRMCSFYPEKTG